MPEDNSNQSTRRAILDKRFTLEDRRGKYTDSEFENLLLERVLCLYCDHYFKWRPGPWMEEKSTCWQCGFEYSLHPLSNITREDYGIQAIFVVDKDSESEKGILLVGSEGDGLAYT